MNIRKQIWYRKCIHWLAANFGDGRRNFVFKTRHWLDSQPIIYAFPLAVLFITPILLLIPFMLWADREVRILSSRYIYFDIRTNDVYELYTGELINELEQMYQAMLIFDLNGQPPTNGGNCYSVRYRGFFINPKKELEFVLKESYTTARIRGNNNE